MSAPAAKALELPVITMAPIFGSASNSLGSGLSQAGDQIVSRSLNLAPTVTIDAGKLFNVMVSSSLVIPPYKS